MSVMIRDSQWWIVLPHVYDTNFISVFVHKGKKRIEFWEIFDIKIISWSKCENKPE